MKSHFYDSFACRQSPVAIPSNDVHLPEKEKHVAFDSFPRHRH